MRKKIRTFICLAFSLGLILLAAACGNAGSSPENKTSAAPSGETGSQAESAEEKMTAEQAEVPASEASSGDSDENGSQSSRTLVVYFSRTGEQYTVGVIDHGNTAIVAEMIAEETGADLFVALPEDDHYPMTYDELTDVAKKEQNQKDRPAYSGEVPDLSQYDTVFVGAPVW